MIIFFIVTADNDHLMLNKKYWITNYAQFKPSCFPLNLTFAFTHVAERMLATFPTKDDLSTKVDFPVKLRFTSDTFISSHGANLLHTKETAAFVVVVPLMFLKWTFVIFARFGYTQKK